MASLRGNRKSSRTSSPYPAVPTDPKKQERKQTSLDTWMEPSPRTPVPSFEDHGFERGGVVLSMAPLGALPPTSRVKLRFTNMNKPSQTPEVPSDTPEAASETPDVASETMEVAPQTPVEMTSRTPEGTPPPVEQVPQDTQEEREPVYTPVGVPVAARATQSPSWQNGTPPSAAHSRQASTTTIATPPSAVSHAVMAQAFAHTRSPSRPKIVDDTVVNSVVEIAQRQGQPAMGLAVKRIYQESHYSSQLAELLDAVLLRKPTPEQSARWEQEIKRHRKAIRKEEKAAKRLQKSLQQSDPKSSFTSLAQPPTMPAMGSIGTMGTTSPYSFNTTIGRLGTNTPPLPSPTFQTFVPSQQPFLARSPHFASRSTTPPLSLQNQNPIVNGAGAHLNTMVSTRAARRAESAQPSSAATNNNSTVQNSTTEHAVAQNSITQNAITQDLTTQNLATQDSTAQTPNAQDFTVPNSTVDHSAATNGTAATTPNSVPAGTGAISTQAPAGTVHTPKTRGTRKTRRNATAASDIQDQTQLSSDVPAATGPVSSTNAVNQQATRARSVSESSLSSVAEDLLKEGNPLDSPPRASGRNTPRPSIATGKGKHKKNASRSTAGTKRAAADAGLEEQPDPETVKRREQAQTNLKDALHSRMADIEAAGESNYRNSPEYAASLPAPRPSSPINDSSSDTVNPSSDNGLSQPSSSRGLQRPSAAVAPKSKGGRTRQTARQIDITKATLLEVPTAGPLTPRAANDDQENEPPAKRRKTARTKHSPVKQPASRLNGINRAASREGSPSGDLEFENSDVCFACNQGGDLVCCDGCENAFHAGCWDPPCMNGDDPEFQENPWRCMECRFRNAQPESHDGPMHWGPWINKQEYENPRMFRLNEDLRECFVGMIESQEQVDFGTYKSTDHLVPTNHRNLQAADVVDNAKIVKDPNTLAHCWKCKLTTLSNNSSLIVCDVCKCAWHLDCLSPPLTHPPAVTTKYITTSKGHDREILQKEYWRCPLHVNQDMRLASHPLYDEFKQGMPRNITLRQPKRPVFKDLLRGGYNSFNTSNIEINWTQQDPEMDNTVYNMNDEAICSNFYTKIMQKRVKQQTDVQGLIGLLHPRDQDTMNHNVAEKFQEQVDYEVHSRMEDFKLESYQSIQKMAALDKAEQDVAIMLTSMASEETGSTVDAITTANLGVLCQAAALADPVAAPQNVAAGLPLEHILKLQEILEAAKVTLQKQQAVVAEQSDESEATAAAEK